ncbi:MAG: DNA recombination protein RmuC, partial [Bacteroidales bacterium]|nr:DNA recombination protein RmuC [Bacteroidales bacterium]
MYTSLFIVLSLIVVLLLGIIYIIIKPSTNPYLKERLDHISNQVENKHVETIESQHRFETTLLKHQLESQERTYQELRQHFQESNRTLSENLNLINTKVQTSLDKGFEDSRKTFTDVVKRLTVIDETQKKIDALSHDIVSLQDVLTDKQTRGLFGEVQLNQILTSIFGERNDDIFQIQYPIKNFRVDAALFLPSPLGTLPIDSKFPLENYRRMVAASYESPEMQIASKA